MATDSPGAASGSGSEPAPGLGDDEYPGFPVDNCPEEMPDLSKHHSVVAQVLSREPGIYSQLRESRTALGVGLGKCIKTGMDNRGHPLIRMIGAVAGDGECYRVFAPLFDSLLRDRHGGELPSLTRLTPAGARGGLSSVQPDPTGQYALSVQVQASRCLEGVRFPPAATREDRREVERLVVQALSGLQGSLKGEYLPLASSSSHAPRPGGMSPKEEEELQSAGLLFHPPDSTAALCSGIGRHWPDARGVFLNESRSFSVWVNEEEHLRATVALQGSGMQHAWRELADALDSVEASLSASGCPGFARSQQLGYLTASPASVGTALKVSSILKLPLLEKDQASHKVLKDWCAAERLSVRAAVDRDGSWIPGTIEVSNRDRLGVSEVDVVNHMVEALAELVRAEKRLEAGQGLILEAVLQEVQVQVLSASQDPAKSKADEEASWEAAGDVLGDIVAKDASKESNWIQECRDSANAMGRVELDPDQEALYKEMGRAALEAVLFEDSEEDQESPAAADVDGFPPPPAEDASKESNWIQECRDSANAMGRVELDPDQEALYKEMGRAALEAVLFEDSEEDQESPAAADVDGFPAPPAEEDMETLRKEIRDLMVGKANAGELEDLLGDIAQSRQPETSVSERESDEEDESLLSLRLRAADVLKGAANTGLLESVLAEATAVKEEEVDNHHLKQRARDALLLGLRSGRLEAALEARRSARADEEELEAVRTRVRGALEDSLQNGSLEKVLTTQQRLREEVDQVEDVHPVEEIRGQMKATLQDSLMSGALEKALQDCHAVKQEEAMEAMEASRLQLREVLMSSALDGTLENALALSLPRDVQEQAPSTLCPLEPQAQVAVRASLPASPIAAMLEAVSISDRRIGLLKASILEAEELLKEREASCVRLQEELTLARHDIRSLDEEIQQHRRILDEQDSVQLKLQENRQKLVDDIQEETFKQRHAAVDLCITARSDLSTVCTLRDISDQTPPAVAPTPNLAAIEQ